ncbi:phosphotransferase family protein [Streptomyces griseoviridis]
MGAPPSLPPLPGGRARPTDAVREFIDTARARGRTLTGHHHHNHVLPLTATAARRWGRPEGTPATVRTRRPEALPVVIRTWPDEAGVLRAVEGHLPNTPVCLFADDGCLVLSHVEGVPLSAVHPGDTPVDARRVDEAVGQLALLTRVRRENLPALPPSWPHNRDSQGFLRTLAHLADQQIRLPGRPEFGGLFAALGLPDDALARFADRVPAMTRRPYSLLHTDLHRGNLILPDPEGTGLACVDWELAGYGDPLHDLATHLVRMRYPAHQRDDVVEAWARAMEAVRPAAVAGLAKDLRHYVDFERAQSVYPDVMRAAHPLAGTDDEDGLRRATAAVHDALLSAAQPLRLRDVPEPAQIEGILYRWRAARPKPADGGGPRVLRALRWRADRRLSEHPDFPAASVGLALLEEGAAPANRVFKGTAHLNTVVRVPGVDYPVVVRRKVAGLVRREPSFLSEHAVLRAIERSGAEVAAPRVLALGSSYRGDPFAIHTYVGHRDIDRPPSHPVHGLLPHEADRLVDQLHAMTRVDYEQVDPAAGEGGFHRWLREQLVLMVAELPDESQQAARLLGLPGADRLREILARHEVSHRTPALLHGDLNPWNLVRRSDRLALTIIDWEMAVVGDPLYELVRHMHLTPTLPEIRDRMFRRWESLLPAASTTGWREDWRVYRWIELVRSAYVDLDRLVTGAGLDAPNVRRAVDSYAMTLIAATGSLGLTPRPTTGPDFDEPSGVGGAVPGG